jgi:hypothetical protein
MRSWKGSKVALAVVVTRRGVVTLRDLYNVQPEPLCLRPPCVASPVSGSALFLECGESDNVCLTAGPGRPGTLTLGEQLPW